MRVIIIEDETVIRKGLEKHVPWEQLEIDEWRTAANAEDALNICNEFIPNIVISDIRMPGMDGIVLCRKLRKRFPECEIIFITGYEDKEYLKAAIDLHAVRYIEKPISIYNLSDAVMEAVNRIRSVQMQKSMYLHSALLNNSILWTDTSGSRHFCVGCLKLQKKGKVFEICEALQRFMEKKKIFFLAEVFDVTDLVILLGDCSQKIFWKFVMWELHDFLERQFSEDGWFLTFGDVVDGLESLKESYDIALERQNAVAFTGWNHMMYSNKMGEMKKEIVLGKQRADRFAEAIAEKRKDKAIQVLEQLYQELLEKQMYMSGDVRYTYYSMMQVLAGAQQSFQPGKMDVSLEDSQIDFFDKSSTFEELHRFMLKQVEELFVEKQLQNSAYLVKQVMDYIVKHHGDCNLSIKVLADYVGLAPTYLSNLFKKNTGMTIGQYIVEVRVEHAKRLMKNPQLKFYQVSSQVGYSDPNYFAKIFKKKTGVSPSEYKEGMGML